MRQATIAIEDKDFYKHQGFDPLTMLRIVKNIAVKHRLIGGSTLTQQLVKNVLLTNERKLSRKIREFVLAVRIEKRFGKDEILQMYLNEAPYGGTTWGISSAAQVYFGKDVKDLDLVESIILAGMPQAPSKFSPFGQYPRSFVMRATDVARRMREDGYITKEQENEVLAELPKIEFSKTGKGIKAPHFVMYVKNQLESMFSEELISGGGLRVITTLDYDLQKEAEKIVGEEIAKVSTKLDISNGAVIVMDTNTGELLSMVGSKDYYDKSIDGEVNVTTRQRQPGSAIKPLVYAVALSKGYSPASVLADVNTKFPGKDENNFYEPKNYDGKEHGLIHLRQALASSINIPAVKLTALVGVDSVLSQGYRMGLSTLAPTQENQSRLGLSMALGGGEVKLIDIVGAYSAFANGGYKVSPYAISRVEDKDGKVLYENKQLEKAKVIDARIAFLINSILSDNDSRLLTFSPNSYLNLGSRPVAVKTGTTNDMRDNWTIGWSKDMSVGVWVGNNDNRPMKNLASGVSGAAPIWRRIMLEVLTKHPDKPFFQPDAISQLEVDKVSGALAHDGFPSYKEFFLKELVPLTEDKIHLKIKVCRNDPDKVPSQELVDRGEYDTREAVLIRETDPISGKDLWQQAIDRWVSEQPGNLFKIPSEGCGATQTEFRADFDSPKDGERVNGEEVNVRLTFSDVAKVSWADLYIDGIVEQRFEKAPFEKSYKLTTGTHELKVIAKTSDDKQVEKSIRFGFNADVN